MGFREQADKAVEEIVKAFGAAPTAEQSKVAADIIERTIIESYRDGSERSAEAAMDCCAEDQDLAHKVADEIRRANTALIANLSSMR